MGAQKMQEVTAAYEALPGPKRRTHGNDALDVDESVRTESVGHPGNATASLQEVLARELATYRGFKRVFFAPNIPMTKLRPALQSYGQGVSAEEVPVLVDTTVMRGAKEEMMLTEPTESGLVSRKLLETRIITAASPA